MNTAVTSELFHQTEPMRDQEYSSLADSLSKNLLGANQKVNFRDTENNKYINIDAKGWAVRGDEAITEFVIAQYGSNNYIVVANGDYKNYYLSYNINKYVGAYRGWLDARYWATDPVDCSRFPGLYEYKSYVCCNGVKDSIDSLLTIVSY